MVIDKKTQREVIERDLEKISVFLWTKLGPSIGVNKSQYFKLQLTAYPTIQ